MSLDAFLEKQDSKRSIQFSWGDRSSWTFDKVREGYTKCARSIVSDWKDQDPKITDQIVYWLMGTDKFKGDTRKGLMLAGSTGTGKTVMLNAINQFCRYSFKRGFTIRTGIELEKLMRKAESEQERFVVESAIKNKLFAIDDLGEEHDQVKLFGTDISVGVETLTARHLAYVNQGIPTLITTNLNRSMLAAKYGARIDSRFDEMLNVIQVTGKDLRKK